MKVISLYTDDKRLIKKAAKKNRSAQHKLYERYAPKMLSVCRMYVSDRQFAEDVMLKGFFKVFKHLKKFKFEGSFEGWVRRIMIREAIDFLRRQKQMNFSNNLEDDYTLEAIQLTDFDETDYLQEMIDRLPAGYRAVFVMYAVEGYKHREIATELGISVGTSKSQLAKARQLLQHKLVLQEERRQP